MNNFIKGVGLGLVAGAAVALAVTPLDKRRIMRSPVGKTIKATKHVIEDIQDAF